MTRGLPALLALALLASGCLGGGPAATAPTAPTPAPAPAVPEMPAALEMAECRSHDVPVPAPSSATADVPQAYAQETVGGALVVATFRVLSCRALVAGNATVVAPFHASFVHLRVQAPAAAHEAGRSDLYLVELLASDERVVQALAQAGLPAAQASFAVEETDTGADVTVESAGSRYVLQSHGDMRPYALTRTETLRLHHAPDGARPAWADLDGQIAGTSVPVQSLLTAQGGALGRLLPAPGLLATGSTPSDWGGALRLPAVEDDAETEP